MLVCISNCTLNKVIKHHGVHFLEKKQENLIINRSNKNDIIKLLGPPSTKSSFNNDIWIFIEKKTSSGKLRKLGKKTLLANNVLVLEIDNRGLLITKTFLNKENIQKLKFSEKTTENTVLKNSFVYDFLFGIRQKINDPLGNRRKKN